MITGYISTESIWIWMGSCSVQKIIEMHQIFFLLLFFPFRVGFVVVVALTLFVVVIGCLLQRDSFLFHVIMLYVWKNDIFELLETGECYWY